MIRLDSIVIRHFYSSDADNDMSSSLKRSDELCDLIMCYMLVFSPFVFLKSISVKTAIAVSLKISMLYKNVDIARISNTNSLSK